MLVAQRALVNIMQWPLVPPPCKNAKICGLNPSSAVAQQPERVRMQLIDLQTQYRRIKSDVDSRMQAVLDHGQYVNGPEIAELEQRLAAYAGAGHCIALSSGTDALLIALMALEIGPGDEVITSPFTFIATGEMIG